MALVFHIGLIGMAGLNPLRGPNLDEYGERFPDMSQVYDRELIKIAESVAKAKKITLHKGVYICLAGPSFETRPIYAFYGASVRMRSECPLCRRPLWQDTGKRECWPFQESVIRRISMEILRQPTKRFWPLERLSLQN